MTRASKYIIAISFSVLVAGSASAGHNSTSVNRFQDYAKVTYVEPVYETVRINQPSRECWDEERTVRRDYNDRGAGGLVGGILGGVAGHQVGNGHGKAAATIVGTLLGSKIGRDMSRDRRSSRHVEVETVCRTVDHYEEEQRLNGYRVGYRYRGHEYDTFMDKHPGKRVKIRVNLVVLDD
jgi:uncharacterized protein YcfJ